MDKNDLIKIAYKSQNIESMFGRLGFLLGQRAELATQILRADWESFKNAEEYKKLLYETYERMNTEIKNLLNI